MRGQHVARELQVDRAVYTDLATTTQGVLWTGTIPGGRPQTVFKYRVLRRIFGYLDLRDRSGGRRA